MPQKWSYSGRNSLYGKNGKTNGIKLTKVEIKWQYNLNLILLNLILKKLLL